jgi:hypothetical protein
MRTRREDAKRKAIDAEAAKRQQSPGETAGFVFFLPYPVAQEVDASMPVSGGE